MSGGLRGLRSSEYFCHPSQRGCLLLHRYLASDGVRLVFAKSVSDPACRIPQIGSPDPRRLSVATDELRDHDSANGARAGAGRNPWTLWRPEWAEEEGQEW